MNPFAFYASGLGAVPQDSKGIPATSGEQICPPPPVVGQPYLAHAHMLNQLVACIVHGSTIMTQISF